MPALQKTIMQTLYGADIWKDFTPTVADPLQGWNGNHPSLSRLVETSAPKIVIDVGVWKGMSTINMANSMKEANVDGCVIAVDTFLGSIGTRMVPSSQGKMGIPICTISFCLMCTLLDFQEFIVPMPQTSVAAAVLLQRFGIKASVIHIDAAHEYEEVLRDAQEYWKILLNGGFLIGDDYHMSWPGIVRAAGEFSARVMQPLKIEEPKWIIQKR